LLHALDGTLRLSGPSKVYAAITTPTAEILGTVCLYLFFATAGAPGIAVAESVRALSVPLIIFLSSLTVFMV
jgi:hypothetical protein